MKRRCGIAALGVVFGLCLAASAALGLPRSLRSQDDLGDALDTVMRSVGAGQVAAGVRALGPYTTIPTAEFARRTVELETENAARRARLGLGVAVEAVDARRVGERLARFTRLQHFDNGYVAWHFTFHKAAAVWQLIALEVVENDPGIFAGDALSRPAGASSPSPPEEPPAEGSD